MVQCVCKISGLKSVHMYCFRQIHLKNNRARKSGVATGFDVYICGRQHRCLHSFNWNHLGQWMITLVRSLLGKTWIFLLNKRILITFQLKLKYKKVSISFIFSKCWIYFLWKMGNVTDRVRATKRGQLRLRYYIITFIIRNFRCRFKWIRVKF